MESCRRWIFVYIEFIEIVNAVVFGIYRDNMIRIIKRSLYGVTLCKKWFKIFILENVCITRKTKIIKIRIYERHIWVWLIRKWKCIWLTSKTHIRNVLYWNFLVLCIVYIGAEVMKLCLASRARNLVLFCFYFSTTAIAEDVCYSQCKIQVTVGLILTKKIWSCFEKKLIKLITWITFYTWPDKHIKKYR